MLKPRSLLVFMQGRAGSRQVTVSAKKIKVGINGFGRIGRNFLRCHELRSGRLVQDAACLAVGMPEALSRPEEGVVVCMPCWVLAALLSCHSRCLAQPHAWSVMQKHAEQMGARSVV